MVRCEDKIKAKKFVVGSLILLTLSLSHLLTFISCSGGDDDGRRLGETIIGTWQCNSQNGDVTIEGDLPTGEDAEDEAPVIAFEGRFTFLDDDSYNGMVRKGSFVSTDQEGNTISGGLYQCDNSTLKLTIDRRVIVAQVMSFSDDTILLRYVNEDYHVTIFATLHKL